MPVPLLAASLAASLLLAPPVAANPIINGTETDDYEAVGGLGVRYGSGFYGPFCSGTLVASTWVLTAAHCVEALNSDYSGYQGVFIFGGDIAHGDVITYVNIADAFTYPSYSPSNPTADIGLLELTSAPSGIQPMPVNMEDVTNSWIDQDMRYVGFGVTDRYGGDAGSGVKRYADMPVWQYDSVYIYAYDPDDGQNVCSGDSGGAGFEILSNGDLELAAVNSSVFAPYGGESCRDGATAGMRVDTYLSWIDDYADVFSAGDEPDEPDDPDDSDDPDDPDDPDDTAWTDLPERPSDGDVEDWKGGCAAAPAASRVGLLSLLAGLGLFGARRRRR